MAKDKCACHLFANNYWNLKLLYRFGVNLGSIPTIKENVRQIERCKKCVKREDLSRSVTTSYAWEFQTEKWIVWKWLLA